MEWQSWRSSCPYPRECAWQKPSRSLSEQWWWIRVPPSVCRKKHKHCTLIPSDKTTLISFSAGEAETQRPFYWWDLQVSDVVDHSPSFYGEALVRDVVVVNLEDKCLRHQLMTQADVKKEGQTKLYSIWFNFYFKTWKHPFIAVKYSKAWIVVRVLTAWKMSDRDLVKGRAVMSQWIL